MIQKAEALSENDNFLLEWGRESKKSNLSTANNILSKIATLSATIVGGGVILLNKEVISEYLIVPVLVIFLVSLAASFKGVLPYQAEVDLDSPTEIDNHKTLALNHKLKYIKISSTCFFLGLFLAVVGVGYKALCS